MNIDDFCGIAVAVTLIMAVTMFVVLIIEINRPLRHSLRKQATVGLRKPALLTMGDSRE